MIHNLRIENFILADNLNIDFGDGLQTLTGETGAGKSILVGAIDLIFAGQIKTQVLRDESKSAVLEITLKVDSRNNQLIKFLQKSDIDYPDNEIFVTREIGSNQRSKSFINGRRVSLQIVREFRNIILDFHSQRDQQKLFDNDYQLEIVDKFGKLISQRETYSSHFETAQQKIIKLNKLRRTERESEERIRLYTYQLAELENLDLQAGEDETLQNELNLLSNAEKILTEAGRFEHEVFEQDKSVYDILNLYLNSLEDYSHNNSNIAEAVNNIRESLVNIEAALENLRELPGIIDLDGSRLEELESRLDEINSIKAKYRMNMEEIFVYQKKIATEIENFSSGKEQIKKMEEEIEIIKTRLINEAEKLSEARKKVSLKFEKEIGKNMQQLAVPFAKISFVFDKINTESKKEDTWNQLGITGKDSVEIYFSANKGLKNQPLKLAASGGELSRFLLTVKKILSDTLDRKVIIFDEIDSGIGGKTASLLGEFILQIASYHQVICITHLAQIASYADDHFSLVKKSDHKTTVLAVDKLDNNAKRSEIARMLSGSNSELALKYAEEILKKGS